MSRRDVKPLRAAIYSRVSTEDQAPETQARELRALALARGWRVEREYVDHGVSGAKVSRPALDALLVAARARRVDVVLVWALDRLGRSLAHLVRLLEELRELEVHLVVASQPIDTTTPAGVLLYQVLGAFAEFERGMIRSRVNAGLARARSEGKRIGRPQRWTEAQARRVAELRAEGRSWRAVAQAVGLPVRSARRALELARRR